MTSPWVALSTDTSKPSDEYVSRVTAWLVIPASLAAVAFLKESNDSSLARGDLGQQWLAGALILLCGGTILWVSGKALVSRVGRRPFNALAGIAGLALAMNCFVPTLNERVADHVAALDALVQRVRSEDNVRWPVTIGPFEFISGSVVGNGIFLRTSPTNAGQAGLLWIGRRSPSSIYRWEAVQVGKDWAVLNVE
jgi:hypothetical protein